MERGWTWSSFRALFFVFFNKKFYNWYADNVSYSCSSSNWDWIRLVATLFQLMEMVQSHKGSTSPITNRDRYMKICILHFQFSFCISFQWLHFSLLPYDVFYNGWQLTLYSCSRSTNRKSLGQKVYNILLQFVSKIKLNKFNGFIWEKKVLNGMGCNCWNALVVGKQTCICIAAPVSFIIS